MKSGLKRRLQTGAALICSLAMAFSVLPVSAEESTQSLESKTSDLAGQLAGINHDDSDPGFRHIRITPHFVKELDWAKGEYHSVRGRIASEWKREGDKVMLTVTIPADCSADIVVGDQTETVSAGTHTFTYPA